MENGLAIPNFRPTASRRHVLIIFTGNFPGSSIKAILCQLTCYPNQVMRKRIPSMGVSKQKLNQEKAESENVTGIEGKSPYRRIFTSLFFNAHPELCFQ